MPPPSTLRPATLADTALLLMLGTIWGSSFLSIKIAIVDIPPLTLAAGRVGLAALFLYMFIRLRGRRLPREWRIWRKVLPAGLLNSAAPFFLIAWAEQFVDSTMAALMMAAGPLWALLLSHYFSVDDRLTRFKFLGVGMGFFGVVIIIGPTATTGQSADILGILALVLANLCYVSSGILARRVQELSPDQFGASSILAGAVVMVPVALIIDQPWTLQASSGALLAFFYLALVGTAFATLLRFHLIFAVGVTFFSQVANIITVSGVLFGVVLLGEPLTVVMVVGMALILIGIYVTRFGQQKVNDQKISIE